MMRHQSELRVVFRQLVIRPAGAHLAALQQVDLIALAHGAEAMRNQDDSDLVAKIVHRFHHSLFGEVVQRAGGFIQDQYLRVMV